MILEASTLKNADRLLKLKIDVRDKFNSDQEFMNWYNNRLHGAIKLELAETPNEAFIRKLRPEGPTLAYSSRILRLYEAKRREHQ